MSMKPGYAILFTANLPALVAFYRDTVGLALQWEQPDLVRFDGLMLHFAEPARSDGTPRQDTAWKPVFMTDDIPAAHARLTAAGIRVRPMQTWDGRTGFDAIDPDGNIFRIANA
jgi:catechol 2,3-dioxygenase-like lactoylglutathione lyase family enzyme